MRRLLEEEGLADRVEIESAGTGGWHVGEPPDERATLAARRRGVTLDGAARQVRPSDFRDFDLVIAMDRSNLRELLALAPEEDAAEKVRLLREFDPASSGDLDVPDPYYGGDRGFETVLDLVEAACRGLLDELRAADRV
jgi:protein-tyrosine phosphatase